MSSTVAWYQDGLTFACQRCGNCCGGAPGYVWVSAEDIRVLAAHLGLDEAAFRQRYTWRVARRGVSLLEKPDHDCVFFERGRGCTVYDIRPRQCRTWPFWRSVVDNPASWDFAAQSCPGIGQGRRYDADAVSRCLEDDGLP